MPRRMLQTAPLGFAVNGGFGSVANLYLDKQLVYKSTAHNVITRRLSV